MLIGVHTTSGGERMAEFVKAQGIDWPVAVDVDKRTTGAFNVDSFPDYYLIDRAGNLRFADLANAEVDRAVEMLLAEKAPATTASAGEAVEVSTIARPSLVAKDPLHGQFLFHVKNGERRVRAILDRKAPGAAAYDVLYLDLDADGDLTESGERLVADRRGESRVFQIGRYRPPGSAGEHTDFTITWSPTRVSYSIKWRGDRIVRGGYGSQPDAYCKFSRDATTAPVLVPGHDRPFQFEHWMSGVLKRGERNDFKVFIGNRGKGPGSFSCVDDKFLPPGDYVLATLLYRDRGGNSKEALFELKQRC